MQVHNSGPDQGFIVTVADNLPPGTTLVSATPSQGTFTGTTNLSFDLGTVEATSNATITVVASINNDAPTGTITNTATISASTPPDPYTQDNTASAALYSRALSVAS